MDPDHNKVKMDWFYLKKIIIITIRGDQFLYIIIEIDYKYSSYCYNISLSILRSPFSQGFLSILYFLPSFISPPCVNQIIGVDPCPINTFLKSLGSSCKAENYCSNITSSLMRPESQLQSIQCGGSSFLLDISQFPFVLYVHDAHPYQQKFRQCYLG